MKIYHLLFISFLLFVAGCSYSAPDPVEVKLSSKKVNYLTEVKPILDKRCVVCHSCYNSPCQAKFSSFEGIDRGGSKKKVYLAERLFAQDPTRLFIDAKSTQEWREKKFFSLTQNPNDAEVEEESKGIHYEESIMGHMLYDKKENPEVIGEYAPEYDDLICPNDLDEVGKYQDKHPNHGMPYGFPQLSEKEYSIIMQWLAQGADGPTKTQEKKLVTPSLVAQKEINKLESFLNKQDAKHQLTARYLYEHYFLAHIYFDTAPKEFYTLVRSRTPSPEDIDVIATRRPYDNPHEDKFYYRLEKIHSTIVHKTHITSKFGEEKLALIKKLFITTPWLQKPHLMSYEKKDSANPFITYAQIPPDSRYRLMLDDSEYFVRTFIRGPVCKGQIALNVIHDHFWTFFQDPSFDVGVQDPQFLVEQAYNLAMPIEAGSGQSVFKVFSDKYRDRYTQYYEAKMAKTVKEYSKGFPIEAIWKGNKASDSPALTIYRHFDSASVHSSLLGGLPRTMWVIDYAHFERIYYALVAGFDVFGNVSHQTNIRRYMDFLRLEGELNFLLYMPEKKRGPMFKSWYVGDYLGKDVNANLQIKEHIGHFGNKIHYQSDAVKQEFVEGLVDKHFLKETNMTLDAVNYFRRGETIPSLPKVYSNEKDVERGIRALSAPGTGFIKHVTDQGLNVIHIRVILNDGKELLGTLVINRWHDNVNSLFGEKDRLNSGKDTLDVLKGNIGSYPNVFTVVKEDDLPDFFDMLVNFEETPEYIQKIEKYGISRNDKDFWKEYDWFQKKFKEDEPLESGLYDLNRYYKRPW